MGLAHRNCTYVSEKVRWREKVSHLVSRDGRNNSHRIQRPTASQVQLAWGNIGKVWTVLSEDEKIDLLASVVHAVEVTEKESVTLELLSKPLSHSLYSHGFGLCTPYGSGSRRNYHIQSSMP